MPEKRTHDYVRHGTTTLFAALNTANGSVISSLHRTPRAAEFHSFLIKIDALPKDLDCPDERGGVLVPCFDPVADVGFEGLKAAVVAAAQQSSVTKPKNCSTWLIQDG